jgi:hypothetical protein
LQHPYRPCNNQDDPGGELQLPHLANLALDIVRHSANNPADMTTSLLSISGAAASRRFFGFVYFGA